MSERRKKHLAPVPDPRSPGYTMRAARMEQAAEQLREQVRRELINAAVPTDADTVEVEAMRRLADLLYRHDPGVYKQFLKLEPTSVAPRRDKLFEKVEVAAIRRTAEMRRLESVLRGAEQPQGRGRPSDRVLPVAVFGRNYLEKGRPEVRANVRDFMGCDQMLDWAYDHPVYNATCGVAERSVLRTMQAMLDRHDPDLAIALNIEAVRALAERHADVGRYVAIDGTDVPAWLLQGPDYGSEHLRLLNRDMDGAGYGTHGEHFWRGHTLLVLTCLKTTLPLAWVLTPASTSEHEHVTELIDVLYRHWPECPIEYLVGDRGFDASIDLHRDVEECYGVHLVTPWKRNGKAGDGRPGTVGTPYCHDQAMTLKQTDYFMPADKRRAEGLAPGTRVDLKKRKAGHRWQCSVCGNTKSTRFHTDPRRHTFLPRDGQHAWRIDLRTALLLRRNAGESLFAQIKHRGVAGRGNNVPRWLRTDRQVAWLTGGCLLALTLRRLVHETGLYDETYEEALEKGLLKLTGKAGMGRAGLAKAA